MPATSAFYRADEPFPSKENPPPPTGLLAATEAMMEPFPADEKNPLAGKGSSHDDQILWMACKEARALLKEPSDAPDCGDGTIEQESCRPQ